MRYEHTLERAIDSSPTHTRNLNAMQTNRLSHFFLYAYAANESTLSVRFHNGTHLDNKVSIYRGKRLHKRMPRNHRLITELFESKILRLK